MINEKALREWFNAKRKTCSETLAWLHSQDLNNPEIKAKIRDTEVIQGILSELEKFL
jgi:hypothetical protein